MSPQLSVIPLTLPHLYPTPSWFSTRRALDSCSGLTHFSTYIGEKTDPPYDLLLIQEPWWEKLHNGQATVSFPGWQVILPKSQIAENERPRVTTYYRQGAQLEVTLRTDILSDLDIMILEIKRTSDPRLGTSHSCAV